MEKTSESGPNDCFQMKEDSSVGIKALIWLPEVTGKGAAGPEFVPQPHWPDAQSRVGLPAQSPVPKHSGFQVEF